MDDLNGAAPLRRARDQLVLNIMTVAIGVGLGIICMSCKGDAPHLPQLLPLWVGITILAFTGFMKYLRVTMWGLVNVFHGFFGAEWETCAPLRCLQGNRIAIYAYPARI